MDLAVCLGTHREPAGRAFHSGDMREDMRSARATLGALVAAGLFSVPAEASCTLDFHFRSVEDWTEFVERPNAGPVEADQRLLERALAALARGEGEIVAASATYFGVHACGPGLR